MIGVYYTNAHLDPSNLVARGVVFVLAGSVFLNVVFPAYYVLRVRGEGLAELGVRFDNWRSALVASVLVTLVHLPGLFAAVREHPQVDLLPHLLFNGLILWEPFFVYGWLQLRYERAFGVLPGILLAGLSFAAYHAGTFPPAYLPTLLVWGVFDAVAFRVTRNLLTLFPFTWAAASGAGTLEGGFAMGWFEVAVYVVVLVIQSLTLLSLARARPA
jgi:membrane protease YdiL (CAAX protease family)